MSVSGFVARNQLGNYVLMDPVSGSRLNTTGVPACVLQEPELRQGIDYLRANTGRITVSAFFGRHRNEYDLGDTADQSFERRALAADYYMYEAAGQDAVQAEAMATIGNQLNALPMRGYKRAADAPIHEYIEYLGQLMRRSNPSARLLPAERMNVRISRMMALRAPKPSFCYDIRPDTRLERQLLHLRKLVGQGFGYEGPSRAAVDWAYLNLREWCMVARVGLGIQSHGDGAASRPVGALMTIGAKHGDIISKFMAADTICLPEFAPNVVPAAFSAMNGLIMATHSRGEASDFELDLIRQRAIGVIGG